MNFTSIWQPPASAALIVITIMIVVIIIVSIIIIIIIHTSITAAVYLSRKQSVSDIPAHVTYTYNNK